ncbi:L-fucose/L-arabinose isomerase family protein [Bradyrhizobium oligotrophicum]|uniref:L-fucose/L-arabinose isomerase family protein n=1 Tax=Bradyrhizobium oligotrophicum TaxID=44255 RepID=UPI003EB8313D
MKSKMKSMTFGIIVGSRGFFPGHLAATGREHMISALERAGHGCVVLSPADTEHGAVQSFEDARKCAALFKSRAGDIDGIIVTLPNFGEERPIADTLRLSGLNVPVLIQATPDDPTRMSIQWRRDSFCGKMSACNNLRQYGIRYSLTKSHCVDPLSDEFQQDLARFSAICRVVGGLRGLRIGAIGARPQAFNTVRYSEKLLERAGISVITLDLSEILGRVSRLNDDHAIVTEKLDAIRNYIDIKGVPHAAILRQAKLAAVTEEWMREADVSISAIQCWTSLEENYGVVPCTMMSMMSSKLMSSACEVDVCGLIGMHMLALASGTPSALLDWNNNYGSNANKAVCFHCSNLPKEFFKNYRMDFQEIIAGTVGKDNTYGTVDGSIKSGHMTFIRVSTDDTSGRICGYVGEGKFTEDPLETFGGAGVVEIPEMQKLLRYICENGFEHHVAANFCSASDVIVDATRNYLGWDFHLHDGKA